MSDHNRVCDDPAVRSEIAQLQSSYCDLIDSRRSDGIADLFAEDGVLHGASGPPCRGRSAITAYFESVFSRGEVATKHLVSNFVFEVASDLDGVGATSSFVFLSSENSVVRVGAGRYRDVLVRNGQKSRWVFKSKIISLDIAPG